MNGEALVIDPPVKGEWAVLNPPGHPKLAFDLLATKGSRLPYPGTIFLRHVFSRIPVESTYAWKQPVFAPADGVVVTSSDGVPDRTGINMIGDLISLLVFSPKPGSPFSAYGGNFIVLKCGDVYPLFAHLRCGSIRVSAGDEVRKGDLLAAVGNSGSSLQPHLHFQVMSSKDPFPLFQNLLPFRFREVRKRADGHWKTLSNAAPSNGDHLQL